MKLYIIRHGQTAWNKEEVFRGTKDVPLNNVGFSEASALGAYLKDVPFNAIYTSPLSRARQTAQALANVAKLTPIEEPNLIDLNFGTWQGMPHAEVKEKFPDLYSKWIAAPNHVRFPEGSSLQKVLARVDSLIKSLLEKHTDQIVALFTHRVVCKVILCRLMGLGLDHFWQIEQSTACLNRFRYSSARKKWICEVINSQCHLESLSSERTTTDF